MCVCVRVYIYICMCILSHSTKNYILPEANTERTKVCNQDTAWRTNAEQLPVKNLQHLKTTIRMIKPLYRIKFLRWCLRVAYATTVLAYARPWLTKVLRKAYAMTQLWFRKVPQKNWLRSDTWCSSCSCKEQYLRKPYATSVFNMELTQPYATRCCPYATDWYDIDT